MATPALNPLVTKIRSAHPGAYDDMDDATLTKAVLAKYPQYSDLAAPPLSAAPGGPQSQPKMDSSEGPIAAGMTSFESQLSHIPSGVIHTLLAKHWPIVDAKNWDELGQDIRSLNPVVTTDKGTPNAHTDIGATAANLLPLAIDTGGGGVAESPLGQGLRATAKSAAPIARTALEVARKTATPENIGTAVGGTAGGAIGHALGVPYYGEVGGGFIGRQIGKAVANLRETGAEVPSELDATAENKPYAGAPKPKAQTLDATGENKPFAGGMDEYTPAAAPKPSPAAQTPAPAAVAPPAATVAQETASPAAQPRSIVRDPATGAPEFSDVIAGRLAQQMEKIKATEAATPKGIPADEGDLTDLLKQSLEAVKAKKAAAATGTPAPEPIPQGAVQTTAVPKDLLDRWGVDPESFAEGRAQTRGMSPQESEAAVAQLTKAYKKGQPVEPVMETRDADNNLIDVDGRSRALAAHRAGVERIPIIVRRLQPAMQ